MHPGFMIKYCSELVHCEWLDPFWGEFASKEEIRMRRTGPAIHVTTSETGRVTLMTVDAGGQEQRYQYK